MGLPAVLAVTVGLSFPLAPGAAAAPASVDSVAAGGAHSCAVGEGGELACWGENSAGQVSDAPEGDFLAVAAGGAHNCAIRTDSTLACWGDDSSGQVSDAPEGEFLVVAAGGAHNCAIGTDGTLACWGDDSAGQVGDAPAGEFLSVSAGGAHNCAIRADDTLACWGDDSSGQVSDAPEGHYEWRWHRRWHRHGRHWHWHGHWHRYYVEPQFTAVAAGGADTCAIGEGGELACWGDDSSEQVSDAPAGEFLAVAAGGAHSCAIRTDSTLACWGEDSSGQVSDAPEGEFLAVAAGGAHACAIGAGSIAACWGGNELGQAQPEIVSAAPPGGTVGTPYSHAFETTPQKPPAQFQLASGQLPPGLTLSATGQLAGTPTSAGTFSFAVAAVDGVLPGAQQEAKVKIVAAPEPPAPPIAIVAQAEPPAPAVGLPPPTPGATVNVRAASGVVRLKCPGKTVSKLLSPEQIPIECLIDVRHGTVDLESSTGSGAETRSGFFWGGIFGVLQTAKGNWNTELRLAGRLRCESRKTGSASASRRVSKRGGGGRKLWGTGKGSFRTAGNYGSASVRGTTWLVVDRCDNSTLFRVAEGTIWVRDFVKKRLVVLRAGEQYVAKAAIPRLR